MKVLLFAACLTLAHSLRASARSPRRSDAADFGTSLLQQTPLHGAPPPGLSPLPRREIVSLTARGITSPVYEGMDEPKGIMYSVGDTPVSADVFSRRLSQLGGDASVFSQANQRGYPNQDNFLFKFWGDDAGFPLVAYYGVWDGHGGCGHVLSELFRDETEKFIQFQAAKFERDISIPGSYLHSRAERKRWLENMMRSLFAQNQLAYEHFILQTGKPLRGLATNSNSYLQILFDSLATPKSRYFSQNECLRSGATMSAVMVDYEGRFLIHGNLGDSPIYAKFQEKDGLTALHKDHGVIAKEERDAVVQRIHDSGAQFDVRQSDHGGTRYYWHDTNPSQFKKGDAIVVTADGYRGPIWDFRLDGTQISRSLGHLTASSGHSFEPEVGSIDLRMQPIDFFAVVSDGITFPMESAAAAYLSSDQSTSLIRRLEESWQRITQSPEEYNEFLALQQLEEFGQLHEKFTSLVGQYEADVLYSILSTYWGGCCKPTLHNRIFKMGRYGADENGHLASADDVTGVIAYLTPPRKMDQLSSTDELSVLLGEVFRRQRNANFGEPVAPLVRPPALPSTDVWPNAAFDHEAEDDLIDSEATEDSESGEKVDLSETAGDEGSESSVAVSGSDSPAYPTPADELGDELSDEDDKTGASEGEDDFPVDQGPPKAPTSASPLYLPQPSNFVSGKGFSQLAFLDQLYDALFKINHQSDVVSPDGADVLEEVHSDSLDEVSDEAMPRADDSESLKGQGGVRTAPIVAAA